MSNYCGCAEIWRHALQSIFQILFIYRVRVLAIRSTVHSLKSFVVDSYSFICVVGQSISSNDVTIRVRCDSRGVVVRTSDFRGASIDPERQPNRCRPDHLARWPGLIATSPSQNLRIPATVPGDIITDLFNAGTIPEPLYELNWKNASIWDKHNWIYSTGFRLTQDQIDNLKISDIWLVFDGIKMGANISINGQFVGLALSQFLRYNFSLAAYQIQYNALKAGENMLAVEFDVKISTAGQFMQCTGGWDWAPYSETVDVGRQPNVQSRHLEVRVLGAN